MLIEEHGFFGNIWVRQNQMERAGDSIGGHVHFFDHVSLLVSGSVSVKIGDGNAFVFKAPTFIVIHKDKQHSITALEDNTIWYCVFACRDVYGNVAEIVDRKNDPWFAAAAPSDFWEKNPLSFNVTEQTFLELVKDGHYPS